MSKVTFAEVLQEAMIRQGVNHAQLAQVLGLSRAMISQYITGRCLPSFTVAVRIRDLFGLDLNSIGSELAEYAVILKKRRELKRDKFVSQVVEDDRS